MKKPWLIVGSVILVAVIALAVVLLVQNSDLQKKADVSIKLHQTTDRRIDEIWNQTAHLVELEADTRLKS